jgi:nitrate/TMAO reductase-like tetraheme cytochrome c subunit
MIFRAAIFLLLFGISPSVRAQSSPHGPLKQVCTDCHTTASWKELASPMKFNHSVTGFPLQGTHANTACLQCHTAKRFAGTANDCFSCHTKDFSKAMIPNHQAGQLSHDCSTCHTLNSWRPSIFEHAKTNFQLAGAHASVECSSCHVNNRFKGLPADCFHCHQKDFTAAKAPDHAKAQFSRDCLTCHSMTGWQPSSFDHKRTNFSLTGAHAGTDCASCHTNGIFKGTAQDCFSCHQKEYAGVVTPNHSAARFDRNCTACHTMNSWTPSTFDHAKTQFVLTGAHTTAECSKCHSNGQFKGIAKECYSCHQKDAAATLAPNHVKGQFSNDCLSCHTNVSWKPSRFDHGKTVYPLTGAHRTVECAKCHMNDQYKSLPADCYSCHRAQYTQTEVPSHVTGQFSHDCLSCHSNLTWKPSTFTHTKTEFPLKGAHVSVDCASCHTNGQFKGTSTDCYACHVRDFSAVTNPNHVSGQFSHDCLSCHTNLSWKPANFNHNATAFPLTGAHTSVVCASCHKNGQYTNLPSDCYSCHQNNFNSTSAPNHVTSQFSHDCITCHTNTAWKPATFNHATTAFPLLGAHAAVTCVDCHKSGQYTGTTTDCYTCHLSDFTGVTDPNHVTNSFDHNCLSCHSMNAWSPATFDHNKTTFPLTGAHNAAACASCHAGGKYAGTSTDCYQCHRTDYTAAVSPAHASANYPTACISCHTTMAWKPSSFNHTPYFPIGAGDKHRPGRWTTCADCHTNPANAKVFSCITCHEHNKTSMDNEHRGKAGYVYDSNGCYKCHPTGRG